MLIIFFVGMAMGHGYPEQYMGAGMQHYQDSESQLHMQQQQQHQQMMMHQQQQQQQQQHQSYYPGMQQFGTAAANYMMRAGNPMDHHFSHSHGQDQKSQDEGDAGSNGSFESSNDDQVKGRDGSDFREI